MLSMAVQNVLKDVLPPIKRRRYTIIFVYIELFGGYGHFASQN